jgi:hydrogenase expression/formation protein HypC
MCLAVPGKVISIDKQQQPLMGKVSFGGVEKNVCLDLVSDVQVGEYVIVHVGFALSKMDEQEAQETLGLLEELESGFDEREVPSSSEENNRV